MVAVPKRKRVVNEAYLEWVRQNDCAICCMNGLSKQIRAHHLISRGAGGSDYTAIPLCDTHHKEIHATGMFAFQHHHKIDLWRVCANMLMKWIENNGE